MQHACLWVIWSALFIIQTHIQFETHTKTRKDNTHYWGRGKWNQHNVALIIAITLIMCFVFLSLLPLAAEGKSIPSLPNFGNTYHVKGKMCIRLKINPSLYQVLLRCVAFPLTGLISLPYAEIKEPFEAWFDLTAKSSRIDYYHGKGKKELTLHLVCLGGLVMWNWQPVVSTKMAREPRVAQWSEKESLLAKLLIRLTRSLSRFFYPRNGSQV